MLLTGLFITHLWGWQVKGVIVHSGERTPVPGTESWVALDEDLLGLCHSLVLDQCRRGQGYPVALGEAHEQAVVTGADRDNFWQLVESMMVDERLPNLSSAKSQSKRTRWL